MTWHMVTVPTHQLSLLQVTIGRSGGTITSSRAGADGVCVTYVTTGPELSLGPHDDSWSAANKAAT